MLNFEAIQGTDPQEMIAHIEQFPFEDYEVCSVLEQGRFYIDVHKPDIIKFFLKAGQRWEKHTQQFIRKFAVKDSVVIDVGAHIGTLTLTMAQAVGPQGKVVALEPQRKLFRELFMNMALNGALSINGSLNVQYYWCAAGDQMEKVELSPCDPFNEGLTTLKGGTGEFVDMITIDSLELDGVSLIKIDVEGMEQKVLLGARETILKNWPVILIEIGEEDKQETILELFRLGYLTFWVARRDFVAFPATGISHRV